MAVTISGVSINNVGNRKRVTALLAGDTSYPTGGWPITLSTLGISTLIDLQVEGRAGYMLCWDGSKTAPKVQVFRGDNANASPAPGVEVTNGTNIAAAITSVAITAEGT